MQEKYQGNIPQTVMASPAIIEQRDTGHRQPPSQPTSVSQVPLHYRCEAVEHEEEVSEDVVGGPPLRLSM